MFETHLFISYAHIDNRPLTSEQQGWVTRFHASLDAMLSMRMGRKAEIWRDRKLAGNDIFADEIVTQFPKTALLISVLSPRYVESDWCRRELQEFCSAAERSGGLVVENKSRVIKVIKTPVESEDLLPGVMRQILGYPFFVFDDYERPLELDAAYGPKMAEEFNVKVAQLAWDITQQLKRLQVASPRNEVTAGSSKPTIYLAECSWDQSRAREGLEAELRLLGYPILPDKPLPRDEAGYVAAVAQLLERASLSIHLVGKNYGAVPDGVTGKSVVVLQNEAAIERSRRAGLRRIIWIAERSEFQHEVQRQFVQTLHESTEAQLGADVLIGDFETLKGAVHATLGKLAKSKPAVAAPPSTAPVARLIYLVCDQRDRKATIPLRKFLKSQGLDVQIPVFEGDAATIRGHNQAILTQCDAVIVFYGAGDPSWKRAVDSDLRKVVGSRSGEPLLTSCTYLAEPETDDKRDLIELEEPHLLNGLGAFSEATLQPLVEALRGA